MSVPIFVEKLVFDRLTADADLTALVGNRVYPLVIPQGSKLPCVVYHRIYSAPANQLCGYDLEQVALQITAFALTYAEVKATALRIRAIMAPTPLNGEFSGDSEFYDFESKVFSNSAEFICAQEGGFSYGLTV